MSRISNPYKCDVCGAAKGEGNKWLLGIDMALVTITSYPKPASTHFTSVGYAIMQWNHDLADDKKMQPHHLCGEKCALTKQAEYLRRT
jgi:hypothetical protein